MARIGLALREAVKSHGAQKAYLILREGINKGTIRREDISLREMAQSLMGDDWARKLKRAGQDAIQLRESVAAMDASGFTAITGQLLVDEVKAKYKLATFVGDQLFSVSKVTNGNLGTLRVPYLSDTTDDPAMVQPMQPYPSTDFQGQYIDLPAPEKFGRICRLSFEMVYADLTAQAMESAGSVGKRVGLWVEKQKLRVISGITNNYSFNGTGYNTYLTSGGWINKLTGFTLTDWTSVNAIEQLFAQMLDPVIGEPIDIEAIQMLTIPTLKYTAKRILHATQTRSGDITTGAGNQTVADNPLDEMYSTYTSKHLRKLLIAATGGLTNGAGLTAAVADTVTFWGDFKKAFVWREVFGPQVVQAPPQSPAEFEQDIVMQIKANVYGVAGVRDPRYVVWAYNSSAT